MPVATASYVVDAHAQRDGKRFVTEYRTLTSGVSLPPLCYGPMADGTDYQAILDARTVQINQQLADEEAEALWR